MIIQSKLQDAYLKKLQTTKTPVIVHLVSGVQVRGKIIGNDNFTIVLELEGKQQMLFKQMISTVSPLRPLNLREIIPHVNNKENKPRITNDPYQ